VAEFKDGKLTSWSASPATHDLRKQLATMFGMPVDGVRCIYRRLQLLQPQRTKMPRRTQRCWRKRRAAAANAWSRADEHGWDPQGRRRLSTFAAVDGAGAVTAWEWSSSFRSRPQAVSSCARRRDAGGHASRR
jgi:hypothetical protein